MIESKNYSDNKQKIISLSLSIERQEERRKRIEKAKQIHKICSWLCMQPKGNDIYFRNAIDEEYIWRWSMRTVTYKSHRSKR